MQPIDIIFLVIVLLFSAVVHEVMHGVAADWLGDKTARYAGRLTLNPIPHIDLFGSIILPLLLGLSGAPFMFAWAKPVPYNPYNLRPGRWSEAIVAVAGPAANLVIALIAALIMRLGIASGALDAMFLIVASNLMLCIFNLFPIPPLDGSKVLEPFLPRSWWNGYDAWRRRLETNPFLGMGLVLLVVVVLGNSFGSFVITLAGRLAGM